MSRRLDRVIFGVVLSAILTLVLGGIGWVGWLVFGTTSRTLNGVPALLESYGETCVAAESAGVLSDGDVIGVLRFGSADAFAWPVVVGVETESLQQGLGWYSDTSLPGERGNFAVTGHRITNGAPLADLLEMSAGELIYVSTCQADYLYEIFVPAAEFVVSNDADWVLEALPGESGVLPSTPLLVVITHQDLVPTEDRAVAVAKLIETSIN